MGNLYLLLKGNNTNTQEKECEITKSYNLQLIYYLVSSAENIPCKGEMINLYLN